MSDRVIEYYDTYDKEQLLHTTIDEAVEYYLDENDSIDLTDTSLTVDIYGYAKKELKVDVITKGFSILESLLESLDMEYGCEDYYSVATPKMELAEKDFIKAVLSEYKVTTYDMVEDSKVTVNVNAWVLKNRPDWLEVK